MRLRFVKAEHVDRALREQGGAVPHGRTHLREIEASGEVVTICVEDCAPKRLVRFILGHRFGKLSQHAQVEGVHLVGAVEDDVKDVSVPFGHYAGSFVGHGARS